MTVRVARAAERRTNRGRCPAPRIGLVRSVTGRGMEAVGSYGNGVFGWAHSGMLAARAGVADVPACP